MMLDMRRPCIHWCPKGCYRGLLPPRDCRHQYGRCYDAERDPTMSRLERWQNEVLGVTAQQAAAGEYPHIHPRDQLHAAQ